MSLLDLEEFTVLTGLAKAVANHKGESTLQPKHFVAAAWLANQKGLLNANPTLDAHIKAHADALEVLLKAEQIGGLEAVNRPVSSDIKMTLDESMKTLIAQANINDGSLLEFVDQLFKRGLDLMSQESVAYHEAGHAVVSLVLRPEVRLKKATIEQEGKAAGSVSFQEKASRGSQEHFLESICIAIAGQVAQVRKFGADSADAGALSDFSMATQMAWDYIACYGLDSQFGPVILDALKERGVTSGWIFDEAQRRLQSILKEAQARTVQLVGEHWDKVERVAQLLLEEKNVTEGQLRAVIVL